MYSTLPGPWTCSSASATDLKARFVRSRIHDRVYGLWLPGTSPAMNMLMRASSLRKTNLAAVRRCIAAGALKHPDRSSVLQLAGEVMDHAGHASLGCSRGP